MTNPDPASTSRARSNANHSQKGAIWDMDGALIDSARHHYEAWRELLAPEGVDLDYPGFVVGFGRRNDEWLRDLLGEEADLGEIRPIGDAKEARYRRCSRPRGWWCCPA